ncbi:hypothetical protein PZH32_12070, partial [Adlercreutzia equolifaciens]|nr:hypothetical protein [Adlercreutzia equolifaciens]
QGLEGVNPTISQCLDCHNRASYAGNLGGMLHAIHNVETDGEVGCFNCHSTTVEGGLALWDQVKYDELKGITPVEDVNGTFTFDQAVMPRMSRAMAAAMELSSVNSTRCP